MLGPAALFLIGMFAIQSYGVMKSGMGLGPMFYGGFFILMVSLFGLILFALIVETVRYFGFWRPPDKI